ncbi:putative mitochondrial protein [Cucumis melo var. makuwa]|uniref:Mitochondrial protein n=1 Tax=Cucumis melo var. makuwa TaxID=1194695 RepID=A0A5D3DS84_CUCMM|nr:putative mitochondrial protein [Cucumis melo var. makuwa]TYK26100.1 putative mitochondrial protein [Cucumis melo var. makuwa]
MFIKKLGSDFLIAQIYLDDIIFGGSSIASVSVFVEQMKSEFEMSMLGKLTFFLGFQIQQCSSGIFLSQFRSLQLPSPPHFISRVSAMVSTQTASYRLPQKISMDSPSSNVGSSVRGCRIKSIPRHHLYRCLRRVREIENLTHPESSLPQPVTARSTLGFGSHSTT